MVTKGFLAASKTGAIKTIGSPADNCIVPTLEVGRAKRTKGRDEDGAEVVAPEKWWIVLEKRHKKVDVRGVTLFVGRHNNHAILLVRLNRKECRKRLFLTCCLSVDLEDHSIPYSI